jgi:hypothetical protein
LATEVSLGRRTKGKVERDEEALRTMEALDQNTAWLLKNIHA